MKQISEKKLFELIKAPSFDKQNCVDSYNDCHCSRWETRYNVLKQMNKVHKEVRQEQALEINALKAQLTNVKTELAHLQAKDSKLQFEQED